MTKTYDALMRLKQSEINQVRSELNQLQDALEFTVSELEKQNKKRMEEKMNMEKKPYNLYYQQSYYNFIRHSENESLRLHDIKKRQENAIEQYKEKIQELFSEYKKYDILKQNIIARADAEEKRIERNFLDEIAGRKAREQSQEKAGRTGELYSKVFE